MTFRFCTSPLLAAVLAMPFAHGQGTTPNSFTLQKNTEIPGATLHAGTYSITMLDSLTDRSVMQVDSTDKKTHLLVLGVRGSSSGGSGQPLYWDEKAQGKHALRGFVFSDGRAVEFVYPKNDAVALAKANHTTVVAVDPASEGRPELNRLSSRDMQLVSLWMLTPTRVGGENALEAKHYTVPGGNAVQTASASPASSPASATPAAPARTDAATSTAAPSTYASTATHTRRTAPVRTQHSSDASSSTLVARADQAPRGLKRLPQTGSDLPVWWLLSGTGLFGAAMLRLRRTV